MNPFTYTSKVKFNSKALPNNSSDVPFFCLAVALKYGLDKVEEAIKNTYHAETANEIIAKMNEVIAS